jgi:ribosomal protein S20
MAKTENKTKFDKDQLSRFRKTRLKRRIAKLRAVNKAKVSTMKTLMRRFEEESKNKSADIAVFPKLQSQIVRTFNKNTKEKIRARRIVRKFHKALKEHSVVK